MELPREFQAEMRELLGDAYGAYLECFERESAIGIRVNTGKLSAEEFAKRSPFLLRPVSWTDNGFYVTGAGISAHPYYHAGLYYVQEPSAMLPAALLRPEPGDRVLDLCAAPGGKATELGSRLRGKGMLLANDISHSRAKALLKNLELHGIGNVMVTSEDPEKLARHYEGFFDKILVDAPCSGEGMFRRDPAMIRSYLEKGPSYYALIQAKIADAAVRMLKPGGRMVYSTCTFSALENERVILDLLKKYPQMRLVPVQGVEGASSLPEILPGCVRLYPHRVEGEGHFAALLEKCGADANTDALEMDAKSVGQKMEPVAQKANMKSAAHDLRAMARRAQKVQGHMLRSCEALEGWRAFEKEYLQKPLSDANLYTLEDSVFLLPEDTIPLPDIRYLRTGLYLGENKKHGFEPSQALAMYLRTMDAASVVSFSTADERVERYLKGETLELRPEEAEGLRHWVLVCVEDLPLGWAKWVNGSLRNKYHTAWRRS